MAQSTEYHFIAPQSTEYHFIFLNLQTNTLFSFHKTPSLHVTESHALHWVSKRATNSWTLNSGHHLQTKTIESSSSSRLVGEWDLLARVTSYSCFWKTHHSISRTSKFTNPMEWSTKVYKWLRSIFCPFSNHFRLIFCSIRVWIVKYWKKESGQWPSKIGSQTHQGPLIY